MFPSHSPILPPPLRRVMMVRRKINGANVVLIYLRRVISGLFSQCRLNGGKDGIFEWGQSALTKKKAVAQGVILDVSFGS